MIAQVYPFITYHIFYDSERDKVSKIPKNFLSFSTTVRHDTGAAVGNSSVFDRFSIQMMPSQRPNL